MSLYSGDEDCSDDVTSPDCKSLDAPPNGGSGAMYERGLRDAALETDSHPVHPYHCLGCGRSIRSLEHDHYCRECATGTVEELALQQAEAPQRYRQWAEDWRARGMAEQADALERWVDREYGRG